ncbi:MAG: hypothetical protein SGILL_003466 [Bacillariaceae sp.]
MHTFMAFLCHELRNPLFIITSTISFLEENAQEDTEESSSINLIKGSSELMLRLVNDVLDISRLESGKVEVQKHDFDLRETLKGATTSTRARLRERHSQDVKDGHTASDEPLVEFRSHVDRTVPKLVHGDQVRVLQVCLNLLSNAVKFTDQGFVDFRVSVCDYEDSLRNGFIHGDDDAKVEKSQKLSDDGTDETGEFSASLLDDVECGCRDKSSRPLASSLTVLKFRVEDTGHGIPSEQLSHIFQPYSMAKLKEYRSQGGTGLGLSIVSKLTQIMHGTVKVTSTIGTGSIFEAYIVVEHAAVPASFTANMPSKQARPMSASIRTVVTERDESPSSVRSIPPAPILSPCVSQHSDSSGDATPLKKSRSTLPPFDFPSGDAVVLVVDDNAMNRKILIRMLKSFNLESQEACNGQEAVDAMLQSRNHTRDPNTPYIGFVLMDLSMPVMGGCEATALIRKHGMDVPIMALTAATIAEGRNGVMEAGADDYATKPILREELHAKCKRYISRGSPLPQVIV